MLLTNTFDQAKNNNSKNRGNPGQWFQHKADYCSPRPAPRARPEGMNVAIKNNPTIGSLLQSDQLKDDGKTRPPVRLRSAGALSIADKFNHQSDKWFDYEGNQKWRPDQRKMKCYPKSAQTNAEENNMHRANGWYDHNPNYPVQPYKNPRAVTAQGQEIMGHIHAAHADKWFNHEAYDPATYQTPPSSPTTHPRTKSEGREYAIRSHGTAKDWIVHHDVEDEYADAPADDGRAYRCSSPQAVENWNKARGKNMANCFDYTTGYTSDRPAPRVRGGAQEYLERGRGCLGQASEGRSMNQFQQPPCNRTRPEASQIQQRNKGQMGDWLDQSKNRDYQSPRPVARIKSGPAEQAFERNKGKMESVLFGTEYPAPPPNKPHQVRGIRSDAAMKNCDVSKGSSMKQLVENYRLDGDPAPRARVTVYGEEMAVRNQGTVGSVLTQYGQGRPETPPGQRIRPEAQGNAERNRGGGFMAVIQQKPSSVRR